MDKLEYQESIELVSGQCFKIFYNHFNNNLNFNYYRLHRLCCLLVCLKYDKFVAINTLQSIFSNKQLKVPKSLLFYKNFSKLGGISKHSFHVANLEHHTRLSKYLAVKKMSQAQLTNQILFGEIEKISITDLDLPKSLLNEISHHLNKIFGNSIEINSDGLFDKSFIARALIRYTLLSDIELTSDDISRLFKLENLFVPRPSNIFSQLLINKIAKDIKITLLGHNCAYESLYQGDLQDRFFPVINRHYVNEISNFIDDMAALKMPKTFLYPKIFQKHILIPLFCFGDTGYSEFDSNDFSQRKIVTKLADKLKPYADQVIFCVHPENTDFDYIKKTLKNFKYVFGLFDRLLPTSRAVICTYRGTSCIATSIANGKDTYLLREEKDLAKNIFYNNLSFINLNQISSLFDKYFVK